ncbi:MAG TPA: phenylalanine--tRNA ligase subunit beta, partial [Candidatus Hydrogenedentes bacterium]|nr:phenylalanine--tRNA ligase subunit beta [Candidatus Hydrogenedentota bacterium]
MRACQLILKLAGGTLVGGMLDAWATPYQAPVVKLRASRVAAVLGIDVPLQRQMEILSRLELSPRQSGELIECT